MNAIEKVKNSLSPKGAAMVTRLHGAINRYKEDARRVTDVGVSTVVTVAGGAAAGVCAAKFPVIPGTQVPTDVALGGTAILFAMMGSGGKNNEHLADFGAGILAVRAAKEVEKALR